jgi:hypothetical protein
VHCEDANVFKMMKAGLRAHHRGISAAAKPAVAANFRDFGRSRRMQPWV